MIRIEIHYDSPEPHPHIQKGLSSDLREILELILGLQPYRYTITEDYVKQND